MISFSCLRLQSTLWIRNFQRFRTLTTATHSHTMPRHKEFCFENYDCVGFDLDNTLCQYNLKPLFDLIYKALASFLIEKYGYPQHLATVAPGDMAFVQKGLILDKWRGNFLKLDAQYRILKASHGTRPLSDGDIAKIYGTDATWEEARGVPHKLVLNTGLGEPFYLFKDYFVTPGALICARIVDIIDQRQGSFSTVKYDFWDHYLEGIYYMYERSNFKNDYGMFFPNLKKHPEVYIKPCSNGLKNWLQEIHKSKVTYLLTSSNYDSAEFTAEQCLGSDWRKYFDLIVTFARKPSFFWNTRPFYLVSDNKADREGSKAVQPGDLKCEEMYSQGNFKQLQEALSGLCKLPGGTVPRMVYFGDSLIEDVYAASEVAGCDSVAIVEEMLAEGMENVLETHTASQSLTSDFWGSFFSTDGSATLWTHLLSQHSILRVPSLESVSELSVGDKIPSCDSLASGYYPATPKALCSDERRVDRKLSAS